MARVAGVDLPRESGWRSHSHTSTELVVPPPGRSSQPPASAPTRAKDLTDADISKPASTSRPR